MEETNYEMTPKVREKEADKIDGTRVSILVVIL